MSIKNYCKAKLVKYPKVYKFFSDSYQYINAKKYKLVKGKIEKDVNKDNDDAVKKAISVINSKYLNSDYYVFYNPDWLGVANSTLGLFDNHIPLKAVSNDNIQLLGDTIINSKVNCVIFSQIVDGWIDLIKYIKKNNKDIKIKVIWHANNSEALSDFTWKLNKQVLKLYDQKYINCFAFVKKSMVEFYNTVGYKSKYLINNVHISQNKKAVLKESDLSNLKIGLYNMDSREIKNVYNQMNAVKMIPGASADIVPINDMILSFATFIGLNNTHVSNYIPTKELHERIKNNDINTYITFTECSPMLPLESFEMGIPCLVGNNNDYFQGTELGKYVIVDREDDSEYIKNKIIGCVKNKNKIMRLYSSWKKDFDKECIEHVKEFIKE